MSADYENYMTFSNGLDPRLVYYLAGPMTGLPEYNYPAFEELAAYLRSIGAKVCSPHENIAETEEEPRGSLPREEYVRSGLELLLECDAIILLEGWASSQGTLQELLVASNCGMPVYYHDADFGNFILMTRKANEIISAGDGNSPVGAQAGPLFWISKGN